MSVGIDSTYHNVSEDIYMYIYIERESENVIDRLRGG